MFTIQGRHNGRAVAVRWEAGKLTCDDDGLIGLLQFADQHHIEVCATPDGPCWPADLRVDYVALVMVVQALGRLETASGELPNVPAVLAMIQAARDRPAGRGPTTIGGALRPPRAGGEVLTYQQSLRTLGTLLDQCKCERASILLSHQGAEVVAPTWRWQREWTMDAILGASSTQRTWRSRRRDRQWRPDGLRWRLRLVGAELDAVGAGRYVSTIRPEAIRVQSDEGYDRTIDGSSLKHRAELALSLRGQRPLAGGLPSGAVEPVAALTSDETEPGHDNETLHGNRRRNSAWSGHPIGYLRREGAASRGGQAQARP
jgi:hypothetical protein